MFTVIGSPDSVIGCLQFSNDYTRYDYTHLGPRVRIVGPYPWRIPPPDGKWYPASDFGPTIRKFDVDFFDKDLSEREWHNAYHGKGSGVLIPRHPNSALHPVFGSGYTFSRIMLSGTTVSSQQYSTSGSSPVEFYRDFEDLSSAPYLPILPRNSVVVTPDLTHGSPQPNWYLQPFDELYQKYWCETDTVVMVNHTKFLKYSSLGEHTRYPYPVPYISSPSGFQYCQSYRTSDVEINLIDIKNDGTTVKVRAQLNYRNRYRDTWGGDSDEDISMVDEATLLTDMVPVGGHIGGIGPTVEWHRALDSVSKLTAGKLLPDFQKYVRTKALCNIEDTLDMNNIENLAGLPGLLAIIDTLKNGYLAFKNLNPRAAIKFLADAYLIYSYVVRPGIKDGKTISKDGQRILNNLSDIKAFRSRRRYSEMLTIPPDSNFSSHSIRVSDEFILRLKTDPIAHLLYTLDVVGLTPSAANLWEVIPFSFVIDWFLSIGSALEALRLDRDKLTYTLLARIDSTKTTLVWDQKLIESTFGRGVQAQTPCTSVFYHRAVQDSWGSIDPLSLFGDSNLGWNQFLQGSALLIQKH